MAVNGVLTKTEQIEKNLKQIEKNTRTRPQLTLEFKMNTTYKRFDFDNPIHLNEGEYLLGLISLEVYNSLYNITEKNNKMRYSKDNGVTWINIILPPGAYEIDQINDEIHRQLEVNGDVFNDLDKGYPIQLVANDSTQKTIIILNTEEPFTNRFQVDFSQTNSIAPLLGFKSQILNHEYNTSENKVNIITIDKLHLCSDCIDGSILNGKSSSILYSFGITEGPGYKILKEPKTILYKKITKERLDNIALYLIDDDGNDVSFQGETLTFTLQIIKI